MDEIDELRATVEAMRARLQLLEDQMALIQLTAQYGPNVDSGAAAATAALWTDDGTFDAVGVIAMNGRDEIVGMVEGELHQSLIVNGCGHVLTTPHVVVDGDEAHGRSYALNIRWDAAAERFWVARVSANTWKWRRTPDGWRITERINANLDGTPEHRAMLAPR